MDLYFEVAASQSAGTRSKPLGAYLTVYLDDVQGAGRKSSALILMADATGSHVGGRVASDLVVATFNRSFVRRIGQTAPPELLRSSVVTANDALSTAIRETPTLSGMACTLVGVALSRNRLHWVSVGDSCLALVRDGALRRLNEDHSYGGFLARMRAQGVEVEPEPGITPDMLMSAMTGQAIDEVDCPEQALELRNGDRLLIVSQGVAEAGETQLLRAGSPDADADEAVAALLRVTVAEGVERREEATAIVVDVFDRAPQPVAAGSGRAAAAPAPLDAARAARRRAARVLDIVTGIASVCLFAAAAAGAWFGIGFMNEWRESGTPGEPAAAPVAVIPPPAPPAVPASGAGTGSGTGLTFGAPPTLQAPGTGAEPAAPDAGGSSLSFGAPAPLAGSETAAAGAAPPAGAAQELRDALAAGGEGPVMVPIPAGQFEMGSSGLSPRAEERPRRRVSVDAFALGKFEVTVAQYRQFARDTGRKLPGLDVHDPERTPMSHVSWDDAYAYTGWLSRQTGERYRLPSEAEWEYAATAGAASAWWWGNEVGTEHAHCFDCGTGFDPRRPTQVGRFAANPYGLHDTAGNVAEWVHDCWHPNYQGAPSSGSVWEGGDCTLRVVRGGGFDSPAQSIRPRARAGAAATRPRDSIGFRVARDLP